MTCKICGKEKRLIKCHIYPQALHKEIVTTQAKIVDAGSSKKTRTGIYDMNIACGVCEKLFQKYDDYFVKFYREIYLDKDEYKAISKNGHTIHIYEKIDCDLLYGFFVFHILRASLSSQDFYDDISIGKKYTDLLTKALLLNDLNICKPIECHCQTYGKKYRHSQNPERHRHIGGINTYTIFLLGGLEIEVKVDKRPFWAKAKEIILTPKSKQLIMAVVKPRNYVKELYRSKS